METSSKVSRDVGSLLHSSAPWLSDSVFGAVETVKRVVLALREIKHSLSGH
jgi:hypothetical protein